MDRSANQYPIIGTGYKSLSMLKDGNDAAVLNLSNDSHVIPYNSETGEMVYDGCETIATLYYGNVQVTSNVTYEINAVNLEGSWDLGSRKYTVTKLTSQSGYVDITAIHQENKRFTARFSVTTSGKGLDGYTINLTNDSHIFMADSTGNIAQESIAITEFQAYKGIMPVDVEILVDELNNSLEQKPKPGLRVEVENSIIKIIATEGKDLSPAGFLEIPIRVDKGSHKTTRTFNWFKMNKPKDGQDGHGYLITLSKDSYVANTNNLSSTPIVQRERYEHVNFKQYRNEYGIQPLSNWIGQNGYYTSTDWKIFDHLTPDLLSPWDSYLNFWNNDCYGENYSPETRDLHWYGLMYYQVQENNNWASSVLGAKGFMATHCYAPVVLTKLGTGASDYYVMTDGYSTYELHYVDGNTERRNENMLPDDKYIETPIRSIHKVNNTTVDIIGNSGKVTRLTANDVPGLTSFGNVGYFDESYSNLGNYYYYVGGKPSVTYSPTHRFLLPEDSSIDGDILFEIDECAYTVNSTYSNKGWLMDGIYTKGIYNKEEFFHFHTSPNFNGNNPPTSGVMDYASSGVWFNGIDDMKDAQGKDFSIEYVASYKTGEVRNASAGVSVTTDFNLPFYHNTYSVAFPTINKPLRNNFESTTTVTHDKILINHPIEFIKDGEEYDVTIIFNNNSYSHGRINNRDNRIIYKFEELLPETRYTYTVKLIRVSDKKEYSYTSYVGTTAPPPDIGILAVTGAQRDGSYTIMYQVNSPTELEYIDLYKDGRKMTIGNSKVHNKTHYYEILDNYLLSVGENKFSIKTKTKNSLVIEKEIIVSHSTNTAAVINNINITDITYRSFTVTYNVNDAEGDTFDHYIKVRESGEWEMFYPEINEFGKFMYTCYNVNAGSQIPIYLRTIDHYNGATYTTQKIIVDIPLSSAPKVYNLIAYNPNLDGTCKISYAVEDNSITNISELTHYINIDGSGLTIIEPEYKEGIFHATVSNLPVGVHTIGVAVKNSSALSNPVETEITIPMTPPPTIETVAVLNEKRDGSYILRYTVGRTHDVVDFKHGLNIDNAGFKAIKPTIIGDYTFEYQGSGLSPGSHYAQLSIDVADGKGYSESIAIKIPENYAPEFNKLECRGAYSSGMYVLEYSVTDANDDIGTHLISIDGGEFTEIVPMNPTKDNYVYTGKGLQQGTHRITVRVDDGYDIAESSIEINIPARDILGRYSNAKSTISVFKSNDSLVAVEENPGEGEYSFEIDIDKTLDCIAIKEGFDTFFVEKVEDNVGTVCVQVNCEGLVTVEKYFSLALVDDGNQGEQGPPGDDAVVPDWVKEWDSEQTEIYGHAMYSPRIYAGEGGNFPTGIGIGRNALGEEDSHDTTGIGVYYKGNILGRINSKPDANGIMVAFGTGNSMMTVDRNGRVTVPKMTADEIVSEVNGGRTTINGDKITTGTIHGSKVIAGTIDVGHIDTETLTVHAANIKGTLNVGQISSNNENPIIKLFPQGNGYCSIDATKQYESGGHGSWIRLKWNGANYWYVGENSAGVYLNNTSGESNGEYRSIFWVSTTHARLTVNKFNLGLNNCRIDTTGGAMRMYITPDGNADYGFRIDTNCNGLLTISQHGLRWKETIVATSLSEPVPILNTYRIGEKSLSQFFKEDVEINECIDREDLSARPFDISSIKTEFAINQEKLRETEMGKRLFTKIEKEELFSMPSYINIIAKTLQEEIIKNDVLESRIVALEEKINKLL